MCGDSVVPYSSGAVDVKVRCDDVAIIYIDGTMVGSTSGSMEIWSQEATASARSIAIHCRNNDGAGGFIASFSNGLTTDNTWRCSHAIVDGWYEENFDDSDWDRAYVVQANDGRGQTWSKDNGFPDNAKWIWRSKIQVNSNSYCRGKLSEFTTFELLSYALQCKMDVHYTIFNGVRQKRSLKFQNLSEMTPRSSSHTVKLSHFPFSTPGDYSGVLL